MFFDKTSFYFFKFKSIIKPSFLLGGSSVSAGSDASTAVGYFSSIIGSRGTAFGFQTNVAGAQGIAIGERSSVTSGGTNGIAIGSAASVSAVSSFMAGAGTTNSVASSNAFANGLDGFSFFNDVNSNYVVNSAIIPVNNVSYINTTKNVLYLGTAVKPTTTIKNGVQSYTNYRTISAATVTPGSTATGAANLKTLTFSAGTNMSALTVGTRIIVTSNIGEQTHANIVSVVGLVVTIDSALVNINVSTLNANATSVANSTVVIISDFHQEIRNDKGDIIKLYSQGPVTSSQGIADTLTNLGLLTGSSVIATPSVFPFTGSAQITGSIILNNALYTAIQVTANIGTTTIYAFPTASYDGAFIDYTARSGSNARAGQLMGIWSGSAVNFTETTTTDFGSTAGLTFGMSVSASSMIVSASATSAAWTIKTIIRSI
jgi:hypothetical protein